MKESDDVGKLFALFDGGKAKQYHEVHEADQQRETIERWPLFRQVQVGPQALPPKPSPESRAAAVRGGSFLQSIAATTPAREPAASMPRGRPPESPAADAGSGNLRSLFKRLEAPFEPSASPTARAAADRAGQPPGSISSLFDRLRRP